jgi:hypothetical protein
VGKAERTEEEKEQPDWRNEMIDLTVRANPNEDGISHINTHSKAKTSLGQILSPSYETGEPFHHPILAHFRSVENLWHYLNTGGTRDNIRTMEPSVARNFVRLSKKYSCDKFRELTVDATILKLQTHSDWVHAMINETKPFDHYFVKGRGADRIAVRPKIAPLYLEALEDVRKILRGEKDHEFVRFKDMNFKLLPDK